MAWEESSEFHSLLEEDKSIVAFKTSSKPAAAAGPDRSTDGGGEDPRTVERGTSPAPRVVTCDASVGTETRCVSVDAQTEVPATADKNTLTVLHMEDLDFIAQVYS